MKSRSAHTSTKRFSGRQTSLSPAVCIRKFTQDVQSLESELDENKQRLKNNFPLETIMSGHLEHNRRPLEAQWAVIRRTMDGYLKHKQRGTYPGDGVMMSVTQNTAFRLLRHIVKRYGAPNLR